MLVFGFYMLATLLTFLLMMYVIGHPVKHKKFWQKGSLLYDARILAIALLLCLSGLLFGLTVEHSPYAAKHDECLKLCKGHPVLMCQRNGQTIFARCATRVIERMKQEGN